MCKYEPPSASTCTMMICTLKSLFRSCKKRLCCLDSMTSGLKHWLQAPVLTSIGFTDRLGKAGPRSWKHPTAPCLWHDGQKASDTLPNYRGISELVFPNKRLMHSFRIQCTNTSEVAANLLQDIRRNENMRCLPSPASLGCHAFQNVFGPDKAEWDWNTEIVH